MPQTTKLWSGILGDPDLRSTYAREVAEIDRKIGSFLSFNISEEDLNPRAADGNTPLASVPLAVKDNIAVEGRPLTCGSRILENLTAPYTATAVKKLCSAGAVVVGKTNMDEFGMGSSTENSALGETCNPWDPSRVAGGSSGGSAAAVAAGLVPLALGSDTGGSVRQPANFCGVYGLKPTYGSVSRYGLTAYASSLEVIGAMSRDLNLLETAFDCMKGPDGRDQSGGTGPSRLASGKHILALKTEDGVLDEPVALAYSQARQSVKEAGYTLESFSLPSLDLVVPAYYTIATAEASTNLARYNGIRYGYAPPFSENPAQLMRMARHEGFGEEVKLRILLGTYVLRSGFQDQYYGRAQKIRTLIRQEVEKAFGQASLIMVPVFPTQAFARGDTGMDDFRQRTADIYTCLANLTGSPALAVPTGLQGGLPAGVQFMAPAHCEDRLFAAAGDLAGDFPVSDAPGSLNLEKLVE